MGEREQGDRDTLRAVGLMSGTSCDGIDAALLRTDGRSVVIVEGGLTRPYEPSFRSRLRDVLGGKGEVARVEQELTLLHANAVDALLQASGLAADAVDVVGFHGQTIQHAPERGFTWQIGDGALLAARTGIDVVNDFRSRDMAAGGQGAPLVPLFHAALAHALVRPLAVVNCGGVANITWIGRGEEPALLAFDTGPGNALVDDWMLRHTGQPQDTDGALARAGKVDEARLARLLAHGYFAQPAPKSLDRDAFAGWTGDILAGLSPADGAATLTAFTASSIALAASVCPEPPLRWLITGGGRHNAALMAALARRLSAPVDAVEAVGWDGDLLEAQAFAYLAVRSLRGLPLSVPTTTGVRAPTTGGTLHRRPVEARQDSGKSGGRRRMSAGGS